MEVHDIFLLRPPSQFITLYNIVSYIRLIIILFKLSRRNAQLRIIGTVTDYFVVNLLFCCVAKVPELLPDGLSNLSTD